MTKKETNKKKVRKNNAEKHRKCTNFRGKALMPTTVDHAECKVKDFRFG